MEGRIKFAYILALLVCSSCATVFRTKTTRLSIFSDRPDDKIGIGDQVYNVPAIVALPRSKRDLDITLLSDTTIFHYKVTSTLDPFFKTGNLPLMPYSYLIDLTNQKRFYYGNYIYLDHRDTVRTVRPDFYSRNYNYPGENPESKGQLNFTIAWPFLNNFYIMPVAQTTKNTTGIVGISAGIEYYFKDNRYVGLTAGSISNDSYFLVARIFGPVESTHSNYFTVTNNYKFRRVNFAYGLNFSQNIYKVGPGIINLFTPPPNMKEISRAIGPVVSVSYQLSRQFHFGAMYRPTILRIAPVNEIKYEYLLSFELRWKFGLR